MQGADGLAALLAGLGFPQLQQARELQRLQQGQQRAQPQAGQIPPNQQGGLRVEIGFGAGGLPQQFVFPSGGPAIIQQQQGENGAVNVQTIPVFGAGMPLAFPTPYPFPEPPTYAGLSDIELAAMEGRERAACEARLNALRNIQTLLDAASLQFQQYLANAPSVELPPQTTAEQPGTSSSTNPERDAGEVVE
jgi:hypothetical protein